jgi:hypothetical protein
LEQPLGRNSRGSRRRSLAVLLKPEDEVFAVLAQCPTCSLAYALNLGAYSGRRLSAGLEIEEACVTVRDHCP